MIRIAGEAAISCQIAHLHGYHENALLIEKARDNGLDIAFDQYPYIAGSSGLKAVIPSWAHEGGKDDMRKRIREEIEKEGVICTTGPLSKGKPHPRNYGNFVRVLGKYVREEKVLSLQEAIRQMTSAPANRLRLWNRGLIRPCMYADIVIFDEAEVRDAATFENPHQYAEGIDYVIVNGKMELHRGERTDVLSGKVLRFGKDL